MKILFNTYPMAFHTPGGGEIQLLQYQHYLSATGFDVKLLDQWKPDFASASIVHFFSCMSGSVHFCAFIKSIGLPLVVSPNLWITEQTKHQYPFDEIRTIFVLADRVIGNSEAECNLLARVFNIPREKFGIVYNGVEDAFFGKVDASIFRDHFGISGDFVLNVANIEPRKNQLNLIKALKGTPEKQLILVGHIRDQAYAKACFAEGGAQLRYLGPLPHGSELLRSAYAACTVFALPSTLETPGLAALEAFAANAHLVVTGEGCTREYFGAGATYVAHDDVHGIAQAINQAMALPRGHLPAIVGSANFTWQGVIDGLTNIYSEVLDGKSRPQSSTGFLPMETTGEFFFAWSRASANFKLQAGVYKFLWRGEFESLVDILIDGEIQHSRISVKQEWSEFRLSVPLASGRTLRSVSIEVFDPNGVRHKTERGVALRDVVFLKADE